MSANKDTEALFDIQKAAQKVLKFKTEMSYEEFRADKKLSRRSYSNCLSSVKQLEDYRENYEIAIPTCLGH